MKKTGALLLAVFLFLLTVQPSQAETALRAYFFWGDGCPHCAKEEIYLAEIIDDFPGLEIADFEVWHNQDNARLLQKVGQELQADVRGVPALVIGDQIFIGFAEGITPDRVEARLKQCLAETCPDSVAALAGLPALSPDPGNDLPAVEPETAEPDNPAAPGQKTVIGLPLLGQVDTASFSLPLLTVVMGVLDGFNPCAMWALLFLISLLLGMNDRRRMWILGSAFIMASAAVYYLFMAAWLNLILFLGVIIWVRLGIAMLALGGGIYSLKDFFSNKDMACKVGDVGQKQRTMERLRRVVGQNSFWLALIGIIGLAFMVNLVELICSAGLPAVYTQVLALNQLPAWQYYLYILLYIFFFMIDDLLVFFIAMVTLKMTGITTKYSRFSRLVGGILMVLIGLLLIFRPEWLMFG
jgi:glutaredoxin